MPIRELQWLQIGIKLSIFAKPPLHSGIICPVEKEKGFNFLILHDGQSTSKILPKCNNQIFYFIPLLIYIFLYLLILVIKYIYKYLFKQYYINIYKCQYIKY